MNLTDEQVRQMVLEHGVRYTNRHVRYSRLRALGLVPSVPSKTPKIKVVFPKIDRTKQLTDLTNKFILEISTGSLTVRVKKVLSFLDSIIPFF